MQFGAAVAVLAESLGEVVTKLSIGLLRCVRYRWGFGRWDRSIIRLNIGRLYGCVAEYSWEILKPHTEFGEFGMSGIIPYKGHLLTVVPIRDELIDVAYIMAASKVDVSALCVVDELSEQSADLRIRVFLQFSSIDKVEQFV